MMNDKLSKYTWHDAILRHILVDRANPGYHDTVELLVQWSDGMQSRFEFIDCYAMRCTMNFGVVAEETIRSAEVIEDGNEIDSIRSKLLGAGSEVQKIKCFCLETNSTGSVIMIFALGVEVTDLPQNL